MRVSKRNVDNDDSWRGWGVAGYTHLHAQDCFVKHINDKAIVGETFFAAGRLKHHRLKMDAARQRQSWGIQIAMDYD